MIALTFLLTLVLAPGLAGLWAAALRRQTRVPVWHRSLATQVAATQDYPSVEAWRSMLVPDGAPTGTAAETALIPGKGVR